MLAVRVIPCLDVKDGRVVKGVRFLDLADAGDPVEAARAYDAQGADELCFLDISASREARGTLLDVVARTADACFMPLTVGGGVRSVEDARALMLAGADKVLINTAAQRDRTLVTRTADQFGAQAVVVNIDARRVSGPGEPLRWHVFSHVTHDTIGLDAVAYAVEAVAAGAGELLVTSADQDGTRSGYDLQLLRAITERVAVPVIASGGAGSAGHLVEAVRDGGANAVLAASIFHFGEVGIGEAKAAMAAAGLTVREARR